MIYDQPEHFGYFEKRIDKKEKEEITQFMKYDRHVPMKMTEWVFHGEADSERFRKLGQFGGAFMAGLFFFVPVIRGLPIKQRLFWASLPGLAIWYSGESTCEELRWNRTYTAYQKYQVYHSMHKKVFI